MSFVRCLLSALCCALLAAVLLTGTGAASAVPATSPGAVEWVVEDDAGRPSTRSANPTSPLDWALDEDAGVSDAIALSTGSRTEHASRASDQGGAPSMGTSIRGPPAARPSTAMHVARFDTAAPSVPRATRGSTGIHHCSRLPAIAAGSAAPTSFVAEVRRAPASPERTADTTLLPYSVVSAVALPRIADACPNLRDVDCAYFRGRGSR